MGLKYQDNYQSSSYIVKEETAGVVDEICSGYADPFKQIPISKNPEVCPVSWPIINPPMATRKSMAKVHPVKVTFSNSPSQPVSLAVCYHVRSFLPTAISGLLETEKPITSEVY